MINHRIISHECVVSERPLVSKLICCVKCQDGKLIFAKDWTYHSPKPAEQYTTVLTGALSTNNNHLKLCFYFQ